MYALVFSCVLIFQGVTGNYLFPGWRQSPQNLSIEESQATINNTTTKAHYFENFNLRKLNPVYWFYDDSEADKLDKLYELVRCVIEDQTISCREKLQMNRKLFEKKKLQQGQKEVQEKTTVHPETTNSSSSIGKKDQSRDQVAVGVNLLAHNSTSPPVIGSEETTTPEEENNYTTISS